MVDEEVKEETKETDSKDSIANKLREADKKDKKPKIYLPDKHLSFSNNYNVSLKVIQI